MHGYSHLHLPLEVPTLCTNPLACDNRQYYTDKDECFRDQMSKLQNDARLGVVSAGPNSGQFELAWSDELARGALGYLMKVCIDYDKSGKGSWT